MLPSGNWPTGQAAKEERAVVDDGAARIVEDDGADDADHQHVVHPLDLRQGDIGRCREI